jgi:SAM-dependent MidA family methyltransferase
MQSRDGAGPSSDVRLTASRVISYRRFIDDALFHPGWGYYSTGAVRFGEGGHYDTYPLALSPAFGRMLAAYAERTWRRLGKPSHFELCEIGAGNGQLCLDVLLAVDASASPAFTRAFRYRIVERSPGLIARQRATLGPLARRVAWTRADLARRAPARLTFADSGLVFGNEVLDCFAPERIVPAADGRPRLTFVDARLDGKVLDRTGLARAMADSRRQKRVRFAPVLRALPPSSALASFVRRHYPEFFRPGEARLPYFATPQIEPFLANVRRLYRRSDALFIDYGDTRGYHLTAKETKRLVAGPPRSDRNVLDAPGRDDITVMVDFSVAMTAARQAGWRVVRYGLQGDLARLAGVPLDRKTRTLIVRTRALGWLLAFAGIGPEQAWRRGGLTFDARHAKGGRLVDDVRKAADEFLGRKPTPFRLLVLRSATRR